FHIDGAFGALGMLSMRLRPRLVGLERADSVAFDFHKWGQVPYDAGCILVRDRALLIDTFAADAAYLQRATRGLAAGSPWPCDLGPDLSRSFRALKVYYTLSVIGADALGHAIDRTCDVAQHLVARIEAERELERVGPASLNIVCFRYRFDADADRRQLELAADLQEGGIAAPSTTRLDGHVVLRAAIVNHRTTERDVEALVDQTLVMGRRRARSG
ncbi:MAG: pyridoxal phosphate-dependent decarboxylase family protein, partial [Polyangiales bacterium]